MTKNGVDTTYEYDDLNRITSAAFPTVGSVSHSVAYYYNPVGQITKIINSPSALSSYPIEYLYDITGMN